MFLSPAAAAVADLGIEQVAPGVYAGAAPQTVDDYETLRRLQVRTVIDLRKYSPRARHHERCLVERRGMAYRHVPIGFMATRDNAPDEAFRLLADPSSHPVYIHCTLGRDRTGLVVALFRVRCLGWSPDAAYAAMEQDQFNPLLRSNDRYFWQSVR